MARFEPTIHFVSGFLGSGKTTAIVGVCKALEKRGVRTAIVTNDQGRYQVDQAFVATDGIPSVAVSNGCLCCRYDDFEERVLALAESDRPEVIFAESVGSCADIVATVVKPFASFRGEHHPPGSLSTFVDARMLEARLSDRRLPFSDGVLYIFDKQIEEAEILVLNKRDLLSQERAEQLYGAAEERFPGKRIILHSALDNGDLHRWYEAAAAKVANRTTPLASLADMDYELYAQGERNLAWLDLSGSLAPASDEAVPEAAQAIRKLLREFSARLAAASLPVGHLKVIVRDPHGRGGKVSVTGADPSGAEEIDAALREQLPHELTYPLELLLNARVMSDAETLRQTFHEARNRTELALSITLTVEREDAFLPGYPKPIHRLA